MVTGCTVSVILFVMAINLMIKIAEKEDRGPVSGSGIRQPSIRAFKDDMTVMTTRAMSDIILKYYSNIKVRFTTRTFSTKYQSF